MHRQLQYSRVVNAMLKCRKLRISETLSPQRIIKTSQELQSLKIQRFPGVVCREKMNTGITTNTETFTELRVIAAPKNII
jgi:hypothetical protein